MVNQMQISREQTDLFPVIHLHCQQFTESLAAEPEQRMPLLPPAAHKQDYEPGVDL